MKRIILILFCIAYAVSCTEISQGEVKEENCFNIRRGVNIAYFLSQSTHRGDTRARYFTAKDIQTIKEYGFDHIRLPIDEEQMFKTDGSLDETAFNLLKWTIDCCVKNDLKVIVDMHILRSHHFTSGSNSLFTDKEAQEYFYELWRKISGELHGFPNDMLAYELLNEPQTQKKDEWNNLVKNCYLAIRKLEPERVIVIGTAPSQSYSGAKYVELPKNDKNIILSFHYYNPFLLTHYKASWTSQKDFNGAVHYPGVTITQEEFDVEVNKVAALNTDWFKILDHDSFSQDHSVNVSGGSDKIRYYTSIGITDQDDVVKNTTNRRYTAMTKINIKLAKKFDVEFSANGYLNDRKYNAGGVNPTNYAYNTSRTIPAYNADGSYSYYI